MWGRGGVDRVGVEDGGVDRSIDPSTGGVGCGRCPSTGVGVWAVSVHKRSGDVDGVRPRGSGCGRCPSTQVVGCGRGLSAGVGVGVDGVRPRGLGVDGVRPQG